MQQRALAVALIVILASVFTSCRFEPPQEEIALSLAGPAGGQELDLTVAGIQRFMAQNPGVRVDVRPVPNRYDQRLALYNELLADHSADVDVFQIDVVWVREMAEHALDLNSYVSDSELGKHFPVILDNAKADGKLVGLPWFTDAPVLYYRTDLLEKYGFQGPPKTWDELEQMAGKVQEGERVAGNLGFWGYIWQGGGFEGLTCNALEWQSSNGGGNFLSSEGQPSMTNPKAEAAFKRAAGWLGSISPPQITDWDEEDSRSFWERGDAAFMRNWSYAYSLSKKVPAIADKFSVSRMPRGEGGSAAVLGGWELMVSKYSAHPEEAVKLVRFLAGEGEQKHRAIEGSLNPTIQSLYSAPEVLSAVPFFKEFDDTLGHVVVRPAAAAGSKYDQVSQAYWTSVHGVLTGGDLKTELAQGEEAIREVLQQ
ncbi:MAG: ABC transporter substrate-binding protein [Acidobacteriota bacterium]